MSTSTSRDSNNPLQTRIVYRHGSSRAVKLVVLMSLACSSFAVAQTPNLQSSDTPADEFTESAPLSSRLNGASPATKDHLAEDGLALGRSELAQRGSGIQSLATSKLPTYKPLRYEEDYSYLRDPSKRTDCCWDRIKYIPLHDPDR